MGYVKGFYEIYLNLLKNLKITENYLNFIKITE